MPAGRPREPGQPRGFTRVYIDLYPATSDALNVMAAQQRKSKKQLIHEILTNYIGVNVAHGKAKEKR